jgi:hypothetical protein
VARNRSHKDNASTITLLNHLSCCRLSTDKASRGVDVKYSAPFSGFHVKGVLTADNSRKTEQVVNGSYHQVSDPLNVFSVPRQFETPQRTEGEVKASRFTSIFFLFIPSLRGTQALIVPGSVSQDKPILNVE